MTQNIYDNETFFAGYSALPRSVHGLDAAPEFPALRALLPAMKGLRVADLGCGFGWFCRWARDAGAESVLGIDVSDRMLSRARAEAKDGAITYAKADLETAELPPVAFDLAYSSLALHYVEHLERLVRTVHAALAPGGRFVFSIEHPIFTAPSAPGWREIGGRRMWPVDRYLDEGARTTDWLAKGVIKRHRTVGTYVNTLLRAGFTLSHLEEWAPTEAQMAAHPEWEGERERPSFLLVACGR
jgi:SAM-dependent methyltransferase